MEGMDEQITTLLGMGFDDVSQIRRALVMAKNDLSEAVSILTGEDTRELFNELPGDIEMKESKNDGISREELPALVDVAQNSKEMKMDESKVAYDEEVSAQQDEDESGESIDMPLENIPDEFPTTNLYELEDRVFTENWSIPYRRDESLGKCLLGATKLASESRSDSDENCRRFINRALPECFQKLLTSYAVRKWDTVTQEGIYNMLQLFVDFAAMRLQKEVVSLKVLQVLAQALDPESQFHFKNRNKRWDRRHYEDVFGYQKCPAQSPPFSSCREPYGWLVNIINRFAVKGGLDAICEKVKACTKLDAAVLSALLHPFGLCATYLNPEMAGHKLGSVADKAVTFIKELTQADMKDKEIGKVFDLVRTLKAFCQFLWPDKMTYVEDLHLDVIFRMLNTPHFNAKMNALKEICRLVRESEKPDTSKPYVSPDTLMQWLLENKVLSVAFESSLHQSQYCEKLKKVVEFVGLKLSLEELETIWNMQDGKHPTVVDNVHTIIACSCTSFTFEQMDHLISAMQRSWNVQDDKQKEKLLLLLGRIGRDVRDSRVVTKILEVIWSLAHQQPLHMELINQAVQSHIDILTESNVVKDSVKQDYIMKCIENIRQGDWVVPAVRHLLRNLEAMIRPSYSKSHKTTAHELQKQHDVIKLVTNSLIQSHKLAVQSCQEEGLSGDTLISNMYNYGETVITHLKFIGFLLHDGGFYLSYSRVKDIWDCLMLDPKNCEGDFETAFEWFTERIADLESDTQLNLFTSRILKLNVSKISEKGFKCFKTYFEAVNSHEYKIKTVGSNLVVEKQDLTGLSFLWHIVLESPYSDIAEKGAQYLIQLSYTLLSPRLKKTEVVNVHRRFIGECYKRLETLLGFLNQGSGPPIEPKGSLKKKAPIPNSSYDRTSLLLCIERLLLLANYYITTVEENFLLPRHFPPHGACFYGFPLTLHVTCETSKSEFDIRCHTNEVIASIRRRIATQLNSSTDSLQLYVSDKILSTSNDQKLLHQLSLEDNQTLVAKVTNVANTSSASAASFVSYPSETEPMSPLNKPSSILEREKSLPGYVMALEYKVFDKLYQLADLEEPGIIDALRVLLMLIPTDPDIQQALNIFNQQNTLTLSPGTQAGYAAVSASVLDNYFRCSSPRMAVFRVCYNLQVLSSKLMPTNERESPAGTVKSFRENFLRAGGLSLVLNTLQPGVIPSSADYELRESCYYISLQLARSLLCGETSQEINLTFASPVKTIGRPTPPTEPTSVLGTPPLVCSEQSFDSSMATSTPIKMESSPRRVSMTPVASSWPGARGIGGSPPSNGMLSSSPGSSACITPESSEPKRARAGSMLDSVSQTVKMVIETMNKEDFSEILHCLMHVAWAAAAGQLQLSSQLQEENGTRKESCLRQGICIQAEEISLMDATVSCNALELLIMCLQLRANLLNVFHCLPNVHEFMVDILTGSPSAQVRSEAVTQLTLFSKLQVTDPKIESPQRFLLRGLFKAALPIWNPSSNIRGIQRRILDQCGEYFELCSNLITSMSVEAQKECNVDVPKMLEDEMAWLSNADIAGPVPIIGHLKLITTLFSCEGCDKRVAGKEYIQVLLDDFLFAASKFVSTDSSITKEDFGDLNPNVQTTACRIAAFELLATLAEGCAENLCDIATQLIARHHSQLNSKIEWEFQPPIAPRPAGGFVGLHNGGATCYMNSVLQQLYMQPGVREAILKVDEGKSKQSDGIFYQIQSIFGHLFESRMQSFKPSLFWKSFKLWGNPVNVREQQDAFEFFTNITDQLNEQLKECGRDEVFKRIFCGMFADQKICQDCSHKYEHEEAFYSLPVTVKSGCLETSLEQFVNDEVMEGDNAYYCEKCCERRTTMKRTCIKSLPPVLVIQLKRFWYDWETGRAIKFDDYFKFPWVLDVEPYTTEGMARREQDPQDEDGKASGGNHSILYELSGIIVHSGQASAGHYYSFIKNRRVSCGELHKWYKFNDNVVEEFDMDDKNLEAECFGGGYRVSDSDANSEYPENRVRYWNAYMLFYEAVDKGKFVQDGRGQLLRADGVDVLRSYPPSPGSSSGSGPPSPGRNDGLSQLSALIRKGERKGIFNDIIPSSIRRMIQEENLQFMQNRDIYNPDYYFFVRKLCCCNLENIKNGPDEETQVKLALCSLQLGVQFLFNTYFRTFKKLRQDLDLWYQCINGLLNTNRQVCLWFINLLGGERGKDYLGPYLIECPDKDIRTVMCNLIVDACEICWTESSEVIDPVDKIIAQLLSLLDTSVLQHVSNCAQYFSFFHRYVCISPRCVLHLINRGCLARFLKFVLGSFVDGKEGRYIRRWTSSQAQEFGALHNTIACLILNSSVARENEADAASSLKPKARNVHQLDELHPVSAEVETILLENSGRFICESLYACIDIPLLCGVIADVIIHCSWCNLAFTTSLFKHAQVFLDRVQPNDLKSLFSVIADVLGIDDCYQSLRFKLVVDGSAEKGILGILSIIRKSHQNDPRRAYQCIKFLVYIAHRNLVGKDYLLEISSKWQWAVDWLKRKMNEYYWTAQPHVTNESHTSSSFQRTVSAQDTLAEATALLTEIEKREEKEKLAAVSQRSSNAGEEIREDWDGELEEEEEGDTR